MRYVILFFVIIKAVYSLTPTMDMCIFPGGISWEMLAEAEEHGRHRHEEAAYYHVIYAGPPYIINNNSSSNHITIPGSGNNGSDVVYKKKFICYDVVLRYRYHKIETCNVNNNPECLRIWSMAHRDSSFMNRYPHGMLYCTIHYECKWVYNTHLDLEDEPSSFLRTAHSRHLFQLTLPTARSTTDIVNDVFK
jgi:hypothetical protein